MASLVQSGKYGAINTTDISTMGYYVITFVSETYNLQYQTTWDGQISSSDELVAKAQYLRCMKEKKKWHCEQKEQQQVIIHCSNTNYCTYMS